MNRTRIENVICYMKETGLTQILISDDDVLRYLLGAGPGAMERLGVLLLCDDGSMEMFVNSLCCYQPDDTLPIRTHKDGEDAMKDLVETLKSGKVGIDKEWPSKWLIELLQRRTDITAVQGSLPVDWARKCKDTEEQRLLKEASCMNDLVLASAASKLRQSEKPLTERELAAGIEADYAAHGAGPLPQYQIAVYGKNCAEPHHVPDETIPKPGDSVILDIFAPLHGYWCDMTRTFFYQEVSKRHREIYETVRLAQQAAIDAVRPGVRMCDIDRAARSVIEKAGYGEFFITRTGHGAGIKVHEAPECNAVNEETAQPGMCFSIEPGIYLPGEVGVRIEDLVIVTDNGAQVLTNYPKELEVIG